jgi:23S rRNA (cytosine1962-C5)-methyltransferase
MKLEIAREVARAVTRGHPWVYREGIRGKAPPHASVVDLVAGGAFVARGIFDATSPLAVRVYSRSERESLDAGLLARGIDRAWTKRDALFDASTTAYRAVNGEGDRVPGIVVDRYGPVAVLRLDGGALAEWIDELAPRLVSIAKKRGVETVLLRMPRGEGEKTKTLAGPEIEGTIDVLEHGMTLEVDVLQGQKTGAFLDQRENRRRVRGLVREGATVLNLFSYTGGFSIAAALGGAARVTSVDAAPKVHGAAQRIFKKNGVDPAKHEFVMGDATKYAGELAKKRATFDVVISDPPSFAPNEKSRERGLRAYADLHGACAKLVAPGGVLCLASCSSHISMEDFFTTMTDEALGRGDMSVHEAFGPPADHPSVAAFREGRYLKFVVLR